MRALLLRIRRTVRSNSLIKHYIESKDFRVRVSLFLSVIFNTAYTVFNVVLGIVYRNLFFFAVAVYYALILSIRYIILEIPDSEGAYGERSLAVCRKGGILLLITDLVITAVIIYSAFFSEIKSYGVTVFIVLSVHCVYTIVRAVWGIKESVSDDIPTHKAAYSVRLASVSMSFFNLSSAIISNASGGGELTRGLILILCVSVSMTVLFLSISMIFQSKRKGTKRK